MIALLATPVERCSEAQRPLVSARNANCCGLVTLTCTLPDYMIYTRGSKDDFNRLASVTGDNGFSWNSLNPYFRKVSYVFLLASTSVLIHDIMLPCIAVALRVA